MTLCNACIVRLRGSGNWRKMGATLGTPTKRNALCSAFAGCYTVQRERDFQRSVIDLARRTGWRVHHTRPALTQRGRWLTPVQGDVGFPDLVLCRPPRLIVAELKRVGGRLTAAQRGWLDALGQCAGVECYLWRPEDWDAIVTTLR